jgi:hypothetical protein
MMQQHKSNISENIKHNDLAGLVNSTFSIDQYKSKLGTDENVIVIEPAQELSQFLETGHDVLDIDVSTGPNEDGHYSVYVEIERDTKSFEKIDVIIADVKRADTELTNPQFTSYEDKSPRNWNEENYTKNVITNSYDYVLKHNPEAKAISERINFLKKY